MIAVAKFRWSRQ